jgi:N-acetylmuramoyl-L-alanine amidase
MKARVMAATMAAMILCTPMTAQAMDTQTQINEEIYQGELQLLACVVYAEAGNQDMTGKRLVVDTILNRVDSPQYPNSITEVIYQQNQFSCVTDGNLDKAFWNVTEDCFTAVSEELAQRTDSSILYFTAGGYGQYGTPAYKHGSHYFSR